MKKRRKEEGVLKGENYCYYLKLYTNKHNIPGFSRLDSNTRLRMVNFALFTNYYSTVVVLKKYMSSYFTWFTGLYTKFTW